MTTDPAARKPNSITVRGHKVSNRTQRRYMVVAVREHNIPDAAWDSGVLVAFARIERRSDSYATALDVATKRGYTRARGVVYVIVDTNTGEEVMAK